MIEQGNVVQIGDPKDIYFRPANDFVTRFIGTINLPDGRVLTTDNTRTNVELPQGHKLHCARTAPLEKGAPVAESIRP